MFTPIGNSQLSPAANAAVAGLHAKQASAVLANLFASHTYELKRDSVVIATGGGSGVTTSPEDIAVAGTATRPVNSTTADATTGAWTVKITSSTDANIFATGDVSRQGADGYIGANSIVATDTIEYRTAIRALSPAPSGGYDVNMGINKYDNTDPGNRYIPYAEGAAVGALTTSVPVRFRNVTVGGWTAINWGGVAGLSVSKNGGPFVDLNASTPSVAVGELDVFVFRRAAPAAGYGQNFTIYFDGALGAAYPAVKWYINAVGNSRLPSAFLINGALGQEADFAFQNTLVPGDVVHFAPGYTYKGFKIFVSGVEFMTLPASSTRSKISAQGVDASYGHIEPPNPPFETQKFLIFSTQFCNNVKITNLEIDGVAMFLPPTNTENIGIRLLGVDCVIQDCYIHDLAMGAIEGDKHTGGLIFRRNFLARCGRLSRFNGHGLYCNNSPQAYPNRFNLVEDNVFFGINAQALAHRTSGMVCRNNWFVANQIIADGSELSGVGVGTGSQNAISGGAPETEDAIYWADVIDKLQHPSVQFYGNVVVAGLNTTCLSFGADSAGLLDYSNNLCVHNTIIIPLGFNAYLPYVRLNQAPHGVLLGNNLFCVSGGGAKFAQNFLIEMNVNPNGGEQLYVAIGNCIPSGAAFGTAESYINNVGTTYNSTPVLTNQNIGSINATPLAGSVIVGTAAPLATIPAACRQNKNMPSIDLTRRTWAEMPTEAYIAAGGKLIPPASQAINTNIGAL
jgi:hypothetical protein